MLVIINILFIERNDSLDPITTSFEEFKDGIRYAKIPIANNEMKPEKPNK